MLTGYMKPGAMGAETAHRNNEIKPARWRAKRGSPNTRVTSRYLESVVGPQ